MSLFDKFTSRKTNDELIPDKKSEDNAEQELDMRGWNGLELKVNEGYKLSQ